MHMSVAMSVGTEPDTPTGKALEMFPKPPVLVLDWETTDL